MTSTVLVTGASGYIGNRLAHALLRKGERVRAMSRHPEQLGELRRQGAEVVYGDVLDRPSLRVALKDVTAAYYLVHSMGTAGSERVFMDVDRYAAENFAREGAALQHIVYLGGLGRAEDDLSLHLRSRQEVGSILLGGRAPATVFAAGMVIGSSSASFVMLRALVSRLPIMVCPRWIQTRTQPIAADDVIAYLTAALWHEPAYRRMLEIGGPEVLSYRQMMDRVAVALGRKHVIVTVPVLTPKLSAYWVDFVTPVPASVAHPLIQGLRNEVVVWDEAARDILPVPLTPFDTAVRLALSGAS